MEMKFLNGKDKIDVFSPYFLFANKKWPLSKMQEKNRY